MSTRRPLRASLRLCFVSSSFLFAAAANGCAPKAAPALRPSAASTPPVPRPPSLPPAWTYWEPLDATVHGSAVAPEPPLVEADVAIVDGAATRWSALPAAARAAVLEHGFAAVPRSAPGARFGQAYASLSESGVPYVVTLDALFWIAHVARDRALAAAEESVLAPALGALLRRLETRLGTESRGAPGDLTAGFGLARGVVSVARSLLSPAYQPPVDLARVVAAENRRIAAHQGPSLSPLLGVTVDYSLIVPRGGADASAARAAYARAVAWLGAAPFALAARGELDGAQLSVSGARASTRAALLIARLVEFEVDVEAAYALHRWATLAVFMGGVSDDLSPRGLLDAAGAEGMDVRSARAFVDTAKVDHLRHALLAGHAARLADGAASTGVAASRTTPDSKREFLRATTSVRILPARGNGDADVLQALVYPSLGKLDVRAADPPPPTARDGLRAMPSALDVGAWLGAPGARALLRESSDDAYDGYAATLDALSARRASDPAPHDSVYASSLDAIATYLAASAADRGQPGAGSSPWQRRRLESALAAWTTLRHDALAFARFPTASGMARAALPTGTPPPPAGPETPAHRASLPVFVEPHPEAIGKLLSLVRQATRGLRALGQLPDGSPAIPILESAEELLADAFAAARREGNDEALTSAERESLLSFPSRLAALEGTLVASRAADVSLAVDVHTDEGAKTALVEAVGDLDDLYVVMREPRSGRLVLVVGASTSHYELTEPAAQRPTDATWRARLHGSPPPSRAAYTRAYTAPAVEEETPDASVTD